MSDFQTCIKCYITDMSNKNISNPVYKKLFPETYEKNLKLQATLAAFINKNKYSDNIKKIELDSKINDAV